MDATSTNRFWSLFWLVLAIIIVPTLLARALFDVNQFEISLLFSLLGLGVWLVAQGAGWRVVSKDTIVIIKDAMDNTEAHIKGSYLYVPFVHRVVAQLPSYPLTFEIPVSSIDTQTRFLSRITNITVRVTCRITEPKTFYSKSSVFLDRIFDIEATSKLRRTDLALWKQIMNDVLKILVDNGVRDVVWRWQEYLDRDSDLKAKTTITIKKLGDLDPYDLSVNRLNLARQATIEISSALRSMGVAIEPLVFESMVIDEGLIKIKNNEYDTELIKATQAATIEAAAIIERGKAEAEVRAVSLARLLDVLINQHDFPRNDPLIADLVRASLYKDGEIVWKRVLEKGADGDGTAKTA